MKKTININFQGQLITIEETAYHLLNQYIQSLKDYFKKEADGTEIVNDIENRIAELFGNRLKHGISCITDEDVTSIINTIGRPEEFDTDYDEIEEKASNQAQSSVRGESSLPPPFIAEEKRHLSRNANDKIIGGVCSGVAHYLKIDPVFVRLGFVLLFSLLFWVYIILWIVLPIKHLESNVSKRLYRNPNDKFIAGVCGGIAAYFKIETWIPRVIFLLPLIFNVFGMVRLPFFAIGNMFNNFNWGWNVNASFVGIYIVLWIVMPKAVSVKQKLEMMGEDEYLKSIRATVSDSVAHVKSRTEADNVETNADQNQTSFVEDSLEPLQSDDAGKHTLNKILPPPLPPINPVYKSTASQPSERSGCLNAIVVFLKVVFFGIAGIVAASLMITLFVLIFTGTQFIPLESLFVNEGFEHSLLWTSIILSLGVPMLGVIVWIIRRIMNAKSRPVIGYTVSALWLIGIVAGLMLGYRITKKFSTARVQETEIVLAQPTGKKFHIEMSNFTGDYYSVTPSFGNFDLDELPFYNEAEDSLLFNRIQIKKRQSKDSLFHVKTTFKAFGENNRVAKANLKGFDFRIQQNDSVLFIPEFFAVPKWQGFRNQTVMVEIFIPNNVEVNDETEYYQSSIPNRRGIRSKSKWRDNDEDDDYGYESNYDNETDAQDTIENVVHTKTEIEQDII